MNNDINNESIIIDSNNKDIITIDKIPYVKPKLTKFGKITNITKGTGSINFDEGSLVEDLL